MKSFLALALAIVPFAIAQCPAVNGVLSFSGPCTYANIKNVTGCDLMEIVGFVEELKEACNAAAL